MSALTVVDTDLACASRTAKRDSKRSVDAKSDIDANRDKNPKIQKSTLRNHKSSSRKQSHRMKITSKERNESFARADVDIFNPTRECSYTTHVVNNCLCIHNQIHRHPRGPTHHPNGTTDARMDWFWIWIRLGDRPLDARRERNERRIVSTASSPTDSPSRSSSSDASETPPSYPLHSRRRGRARKKTDEDEGRRRRRREKTRGMEGEKYFYDEFARTWTLVALNAATRPTKEEARSADILVISVMECARE